MLKIRGKTQVTIVAMTLITLALILYRLSTSEVLVDSAFAKDRHVQAPVSVHDLEGASEITPNTLRPELFASHKAAEARIMDDIRGRIDAEENTLDRRVMLPHRHKYENSDNGNSDSVRIGSSTFFSGHKIVHLDLKGAAPKVSYYEELFSLLRNLGASGILIEYEDMFPYSGSLKDLPAYNAYSRSDIKKIVKLAGKNNLEVIPLIQTFGHLEFVLKLEKYSSLREMPKYPQVICPSNNDTFPLIALMVDQIMELHPNIKHLHIGCDEVYYLGNCIRCGMAMIDNKWTKSQLFLNHVVRVAKYVRKHYKNVVPLTWDDEFRKLSELELQESGVARWLEPVVWKYSPDLATSIAPEVWEKYIAIFPALWIASAFKGATGPDKYVTDTSYHLENHRVWMDIVNMYSRRIKFRGIMLTGWQRYDHFAVLCELLPVGLPSLAANLAYIQGENKEMSAGPDRVMDVLKCDPPMPLGPGMGHSHCGFPGSGVLEAAERLYILEQNIDRYLADSTVKGWFTTYNIEHGFSSPSLVERATAELDHCKMELMYIEKDMTTAMNEIFDHYTTSEWISTYIRPLDAKLQNLWDAKEKLLALNSWPKRPLGFSESNEKSTLKSRTAGTL